ncbi:1-phosphofructokinase [Thalassobacillus sp. CUG 92003]|uniref:1-phosphofructokinase n=1 Tax=Thalassobacillus sp. CUG 92003 TaxID=2736641 RepID=UPI0015E79BAB|nr:1-phosphofructokinase [Thalassobacillus sp. CUG 92003]
MIYTCTLNPSIDYVMHIERFEEGGLNRAAQTFYYPGGKGINVSRVLRRLDTETTALGFIGGFTGDFIKRHLGDEAISHNFIETGQTTRINVKLKAGSESEINGPGPAITAEQQHALLNEIARLTAEDTLVLAGSLPSSLPGDFYEQIARLCYERDVALVADTSGPALHQMAKQPVLLLKPNHHELGELFDTSITNKEKAAYYAKQLLADGPQNIIVSMGAEGAVFVNAEHQWYANTPEGKLINSVGAGDSVVSGFLSAYTKNQGLEQAFKYGIAAGSATAFSDDLCTRQDVESIVTDIYVSPIS